MTNGNDGKPLTAPQQRAYDFLVEHGTVYPRELAMLMWPDSPGWNRRSRRHATPAGGAMGATMPMKAATLLWKLRDKGLARKILRDSGHSNLWEPIAPKGTP